MMDFADDFTYFSFEQLLQEARNLYRFNKHIEHISLTRTKGNQPELLFHLNTRKPLTLKQLGLPVTFRCVSTRLVAANQ